jgi:antitoxin component of RelBE/YafQ-DinJ toxin-antitoxin module
LPRSQVIRYRIDSKVKSTLDELIFELGTDWTSVTEEAILHFLSELEKRAEIVKRKNLPSPMNAVPP